MRTMTKGFATPKRSYPGCALTWGWRKRISEMGYWRRSLVLAAGLLLFTAGGYSNRAAAQELPLKPFTSDGCSMFPDGPPQDPEKSYNFV